jgi:hypothetical protein
LSEDDLEIIAMNATYEAFGMVMDFLSGAPPFNKFDLAYIAELIRAQLQLGHHLGAVTGQREMVGYAGWIHTSEANAELWMRDMGVLRPVETGRHDAAALTIVAVTDSRATPRLLRGARALNPGVRVFFKRSYDDALRPPKKASVLNFGDPEPEPGK